MNVWSKVVLFFLGIAVFVFFHAAIRTVKTFYYWSGQVAKFQADLERTRRETALLRTADHEHPLEDKTVGVQQLHFDLGRMITNRGRIWSNCQKKQVQKNGAQAGRTEVQVVCDEPGISDKMLLYAFEEGDDQSPGKYLGEFAVKAISQNNVLLVSTTPLTPIQEKTLSESKTTMPWVLYEVMPADQHELFASLPDELRKRYFPDPDPGLSKAEQTRWKMPQYIDSKGKWWLPEEYATDAQTVGTPNERKLRDYLEIIRVCDVDRTLFADRMNALDRDQTYVNSALTDSQTQLAFAEKEKAQAGQERAWEYKQRDATAALYGTLQKMLSFNQAAVQAAISANANAARQIAKIRKRRRRADRSADAQHGTKRRGGALTSIGWNSGD